MKYKLRYNNTAHVKFTETSNFTWSDKLKVRNDIEAILKSYTNDFEITKEETLKYGKYTSWVNKQDCEDLPMYLFLSCVFATNTKNGLDLLTADDMNLENMTEIQHVALEDISQNIFLTLSKSIVY